VGLPPAAPDPPPLRPQPAPIAAGLVVVALLIGALMVLRPVATGLVLGALLVVISWRPFQWLAGKLGPRHVSMAAGLATTALVVVLMAPLGLLAYRLILQATAAVAWLTSRTGQLGGVSGWLDMLPQWLRTLVAPEAKRLGSTAAQLIGHVAQALPAIASSFSSLLIQAFLTVVAMFYGFRDGPAMVAFVRRVSPFSPEETSAFLADGRSLAHSLFYGNAVAALAHGAVAGLGYLILGAPSALLLAALTAFASFVPVVGTALVTIPVAIGLGVAHGWTRGLLMLGWAVILVGGVDNVLRPLVTRGQGAPMHSLLVFASLFGGIAVFGIEGLVLGPMLVGLGATALRRMAERRNGAPVPAV
jgi:predicted PurR-regulated permease PerM